jgi:hypothetical protein
VIVECPHCRKELDFPTGKAGEVRTCGSCGGKLRLPDPYPPKPSGGELPPVAVAAPAPRPAERRPAPPAARAPDPGLSAAATVCGSVGVLCPLPLLGLAAVLLGTIAFRRRAYPRLAITGICLGALNLIEFTVVLVWFLENIY